MQVLISSAEQVVRAIGSMYATKGICIYDDETVEDGAIVAATKLTLSRNVQSSTSSSMSLRRGGNAQMMVGDSRAGETPCGVETRDTGIYAKVDAIVGGRNRDRDRMGTEAIEEAYLLSVGVLPEGDDELSE